VSSDWQIRALTVFSQLSVFSSHAGTVIGEEPLKRHAQSGVADDIGMILEVRVTGDIKGG
jgi:hypothetical protein